MNRLVRGLGVVWLGAASLAGCATSVEPEQECLPGDMDCDPLAGELALGGDGKSDVWDPKNNPSQMAHNLNYRLRELPRRADRTIPVWATQYPYAVGKAAAVWADNYWPTADGSHNFRWQGAAIPSPLEKYDAAFNNHRGCAEHPSKPSGAGAKAAWDRYYACAGPAAKWQSREFQGAGKMHDGRDNDGDGVIDDRGPSGEVDGVATWWGTCHAWGPAAMMVPEPQHPVTVGDVTFTVGDIKGLIQNVFDSTAAIMLGGRCNAKTIEHGPTGSANLACADANPGAFHVVVTNFLGISNLPLVEDRTANFEVWNQPVVGYEITRQEPISAEDANNCVGATGTTWTYNTSAKELFEIRMTVRYVTESQQSNTPLGFANHTRTDRYHYIVELDRNGKVVGGRYCTDSDNNHVDFLWTPTGRFNPSNPHVSVARVKELIAKSVVPLGGGTSKEFSATPNAAIPDDNATGVTVDIPVTGVTGSPSLAVSIDIRHSYRGDLVVELLRDGRKLKTLHDATGGSADDLVQTYTLSPAEVGSPNGRWTVKVTDTAAIDVGTVATVKLSFTGG